MSEEDLDARTPLGTSLESLHRLAGEVLENSTTGGQGDHLGMVLQLDRDLHEWEMRLVDRPESAMITEARRHLGWSIYAAATGLYSLAYSGLRVSLELSFAAVYFSANELHRRRWLGDRADFSWSRALDSSDGVLSRSFVREFNETAADDAVNYANSAQARYRECSQFMHGKFAATSAVPSGLEYSAALLEAWARCARDSARAVLFLLYARYGVELLPSDSGKLAATLEDNLGHLVSVRTDLGLPVRS